MDIPQRGKRLVIEAIGFAYLAVKK